MYLRQYTKGLTIGLLQRHSHAQCAGLLTVSVSYSPLGKYGFRKLFLQSYHIIEIVTSQDEKIINIYSGLLGDRGIF